MPYWIITFWRFPFIHPLLFIVFTIVFVPVDFVHVDFGFVVDVNIGPLP
jgi:hypothetical protein